MTYEAVADLPLLIEGYDLVLHERETSSEFTRVSTSVELQGNGHTGYGEDVTYSAEAHQELHSAPMRFPVRGEYSFNGFSEHVALFDFFFGEEPDQPIFRQYRRWAFESAALDLALKQANTSLGTVVGRTYDPVRFVVSTRLEDPPAGDRVIEWLDRNPDLEFKLDPTSEWTKALIDRLAETDSVQILDLKGQYEGTDVDQPADSELYDRLIAGFPDALLEDPALTPSTRAIFDGHESRITWDYPIRGIDSIERLPWRPSWLNIKPSRFGSVRSLLETISYCERHDIRMFGGGQFELAAGRDHLQHFASLWYPDSPNDVAPSEYNLPTPPSNLASSPLEPPESPFGLEW